MSHQVTGDRNFRTPPRIRTEDEVAEIHAGNWATWTAGMTPDEKLALERLELTAPEPPRKGHRTRHVPPEDGEIELGTCEHMEAPSFQRPDERLMAEEDQADSKRRELLLLAQVLPTIADAADARLEASIVALALRIGARQGITYEVLSERQHLHKLAISKRVTRCILQLSSSAEDVDLLRYVIGPIRSSRTPGLEAEAIGKAAQIGLSNADRMEDVGRKHGVCRQAISRRVRHWCEKLGLPLPRECKRNTEAYRLHNVTKQKIDPFQ